MISENEHLHEAQKNKLISRMFHSYNGSESDELDELGDSTGLDSDNKVVITILVASTRGTEEQFVFTVDQKGLRGREMNWTS